MVNIVLNEEKLKAFLPQSGIRQGGPLYPYVFDAVGEVLAGAIGIPEEAQGSSYRQKRSLSIFICRFMVVYINDCKNSTRKLV